MSKISISKITPWIHGYIGASILYYWMASSLLNPFAILLLIGFSLHLFVAKNDYKLIFPVVFLLLNAFMFLALFSEFSEFETLSRNAMLLLLVGIPYLGCNVIGALVMIKASANSTDITANA